MEAILLSFHPSGHRSRDREEILKSQVFKFLPERTHEEIADLLASGEEVVVALPSRSQARKILASASSPLQVTRAPSGFLAELMRSLDGTRKRTAR